MRFDSYKCNNCERIKGEVNNWYSATDAGADFVICAGIHDDPSGTKHLCSEACVIAVTQQWMSKIKESHSPTT
jgi:hypothetical protein